MKSKQQNKICGISKIKSLVFYYKVCTTILTSQNYVSNNEFFFPISSPFGSPKSYHDESKPTRLQNSNLQCFMISPYPNCLTHPKPCKSYPLNNLIHLLTAMTDMNKLNSN